MEIREALEQAFEKDETSTPAASPETPAVSAPEPSDTPEPSPSDEAAPSSEPAAKAPEKPADAPDAAPAPTEQQAREHRVDRPPQSWRGAAKGEWAALPLQVRQEVYRREQEVNKVLRETAETRQTAEQFQQTVAPYMGRIQSFGVTPHQAVGELLKADMVLATGSRQQKAQLVVKLINDYGVDVQDLDSALAAHLQGQAGPAQQSQQFDPSMINQLVQQQLQQALAPMYQQQQQREMQSQQEAVQSVEQMSLDPAYPFFDDVRQEMADLIEVASRRGIVLSLQDAYTKAVALDPTVSGQQARQTQVTQANQAHLQAQSAKNASSSITGAPASGGLQTHTGDGSLRGAIEAAFNNTRI